MSMQRLWLGLRGGLILCLAFSLSACQSGLSSSGSVGQASVPCSMGRYVDGQGKTGIRGHVILKDDGSPLDGGYVEPTLTPSPTCLALPSLSLLRPISMVTMKWRF